MQTTSREQSPKRCIWNSKKALKCHKIKQNLKNIFSNDFFEKLTNLEHPTKNDKIQKEEFLRSFSYPWWSWLPPPAAPNEELLCISNTRWCWCSREMRHWSKPHFCPSIQNTATRQLDFLTGMSRHTLMQAQSWPLKIKPHCSWEIKITRKSTAFTAEYHMYWEESLNTFWSLLLSI